jgi:hypothetical protein
MYVDLELMLIKKCFFVAGIFSLSVAGLVHPACAQIEKDPIATDRPDIAESSLTVGNLVYQFEQGVTATREGKEDSLGFPSLHRIGIMDNLELRVETPIIKYSGTTIEPEPVALGAKWHVLDGGGSGELPSMALLGHIETDGKGNLKPIFKFLADATLPFNIGLGVNLNAWKEHDSVNPHLGGAASFALPITDAWRIYTEVSGENNQTDSGNTFGVDAGTAYLLDADTQLDLAAYKSFMPRDVETLYITAGLSKRYGK